MVGLTMFKITGGSFSYTHTPLFDNLELALEKGKFYGLIGPNGSGKSTLLDILLGLVRLTSGNVYFNNKPVEHYSRRELARKIAHVPQSLETGFDFSVFDIVMMGRHPHIPRFHQPSPTDFQQVEEALRLMDIAHLRERPVSQLSGGEKQRVIVARALTQSTDSLMLDEATSHLDIEHTLQIMQVLRAKVDLSGTTVIAAIHDINVAAAFCDDLIVLKDGALHSIGRVSQILTEEMLANVFSVKATIVNNEHYPRIEFAMHSAHSST